MNVRIYPRSINEKGGIAMMPLRRNIPEGKPDWKLVKCPRCGQECWKRPEFASIIKEQGMRELCTECSLRETAAGCEN